MALGECEYVAAVGECDACDHDIWTRVFKHDARKGDVRVRANCGHRVVVDTFQPLGGAVDV